MLFTVKPHTSEVPKWEGKLRRETSYQYPVLNYLTSFLLLCPDL